MVRLILRHRLRHYSTQILRKKDEFRFYHVLVSRFASTISLSSVLRAVLQPYFLLKYGLKNNLQVLKYFTRDYASY